MAEPKEVPQNQLPGSAKKCDWKVKLCYGLGHVLNDLCAAVWFSYTLFYLQIVVSLGPSTAGILLMIGQLVDALATPAVGWIVDRTKKRKACHVAGSCLVTLGFVLIFCMKPSQIHLSPLPFYFLCITLFQIGWAFVQISHLAILPFISTSRACSDELTAIRHTCSVCCNIIVYLITWITFEYTENATPDIGIQDAYKFRIIALALVVIGIICTTVFYAGVEFDHDVIEDGDVGEDVNIPCKNCTSDLATTSNPPVEPIEANGEETDEHKTEHSSAMEIADQQKVHSAKWKTFMKAIVIYFVAVMYMCARLFSCICLIYIPLYLNENESSLAGGNLRSAIAIIPLVLFVSSFLTALALKFIPNRIKNWGVYLIGGSLSLLACIWIVCDGGTGFYFRVGINAAIIGVGNSMTMISSLRMTTLYLKKFSLKSGFVYSTVTLVDKLVSGVVVVSVQRTECVENGTCTDFYRLVFGYICGATSCFGMISLGILLIFLRYLKNKL